MDTVQMPCGPPENLPAASLTSSETLEVVPATPCAINNSGSPASSSLAGLRGGGGGRETSLSLHITVHFLLMKISHTVKHGRKTQARSALEGCPGAFSFSGGRSAWAYCSSLGCGLDKAGVNLLYSLQVAGRTCRRGLDSTCLSTSHWPDTPASSGSSLSHPAGSLAGEHAMPRRRVIVYALESFNLL